MPPKKYRPEVTYVNLSESFLARTRCKFCMESPTIHYKVRDAILWHNPRKVTDVDLKWKNKYWTRMCSDFYLDDDPSDFTRTNYFSWRQNKAYNPKLHKNINVSPFTDNDLLTCECGRTAWAFCGKSSKSRPEIICRRSRRQYPQKFQW